MKEASDKTGPQYQRMTWDALRKSLNGIINKVNVQNIKEILPDLFKEVCSAQRSAAHSTAALWCNSSGNPNSQSMLCLSHF